MATSSPGNTLSEYGLIALLIAVLAISTLGILGHNLSQMMSQSMGVRVAAPPIHGLIGHKSVHGGATLASDNNSSGLTQTPGHVSDDNTTLEQITGNSQNATSVDGGDAVAKVYRNMALLQQLKQVLRDSGDTQLQQWAKVLTVRMEWLTASEGVSVDMPDFQALVQGKSYSRQSALSDIYGYPIELQQIVNGTGVQHGVASKPDNVDPAVWKKITSIIDQTVENSRSLAAQLDPSNAANPPQTAWNGQYNRVTGNTPKTAAAIQQAAADGSLANHRPVKTTVDHTEALNQTVDNRLY